MPRQRRVVRVAARGQVGRRNQGSGTVHDHVGRDDSRSRSIIANVSSRWTITRPLTLLGASGLKIVGRPRVEIANPFWHRLCRTLYADVRGIRAVSAIVSALPYPWATSAM